MVRKKTRQADSFTPPQAEGKTETNVTAEQISLPPSPRRVLIVKPSALGDVVTALPVMRALRRTHPETHIAWLVSTTCADILRGEDDIDELIYFERKKLGRAWYSPAAFMGLVALRGKLKTGRFDWVIDLQGLARSGIFTRWTGAKVRAGFADAREGAWAFYNYRLDVRAEHTVDRNIALARELGLDARPADMSLSLDHQARRFAEQFCCDHHLTPGEYLVCVVPTRWNTKLYPVRHWRTVLAGLTTQLPVVLTGSPSPAEMAICREVAQGIGSGLINAAGRTGQAELAAVIRASSGVVCCDSAAKFIAPAVGREALTLIGPTRVERTGPYLTGRALVADVPCQGCLKKYCPHATCMQSISPKDVIATTMQMLDTDRKLVKKSCR
jgi:lipopolysaccharide heptosyltransferase I